MKCLILQQQSSEFSREFINTSNHNQLICTKLSGATLPVRYNGKKLFFTLLYSLCLTLSLISFIQDSDLLIKANLLLGVFGITLLSTRIRREDVPIYIFVAFLAASFFVSSFYVERTGWRLFQPIIFIVSSFGAAMILVRGYVYSWSGYIVFYCLTGFFLMLMITGSDANTVLKNCSHNGISQVMLIACISLYITLSIEKKQIDLKPALFTLFISIWAVSRSGIFSSILLLFRIQPLFVFNNL